MYITCHSGVRKELPIVGVDCQRYLKADLGERQPFAPLYFHTCIKVHQSCIKDSSHQLMFSEGAVPIDAFRCELGIVACSG